MTIENGKITSATEGELYTLWLRRDMCDIMPFPEYKQGMQRAGCKVIEEEDK